MGKEIGKLSFIVLICWYFVMFFLAVLGSFGERGTSFILLSGIAAASSVVVIADFARRDWKQWRAILGTLCLLISGAIIIVSYLRRLHFSGELLLGSEDIPSIIFAGIISAAFTTAGLAFWGWDRWRIVLGAMFTLTGAITLFWAVFVIAAPKFIHSYGTRAGTPDLYIISPGIVMLTVGILLFRKQKKSGKNVIRQRLARKEVKV